MPPSRAMTPQAWARGVTELGKVVSIKFPSLRITGLGGGGVAAGSPPGYLVSGCPVELGGTSSPTRPRASAADRRPPGKACRPWLTARRSTLLRNCPSSTATAATATATSQPIGHHEAFDPALVSSVSLPVFPRRPTLPGRVRELRPAPETPRCTDPLSCCCSSSDSLHFLLLLLFVVPVVPFPSFVKRLPAFGFWVALLGRGGRIERGRPQGRLREDALAPGAP